MKIFRGRRRNEQIESKGAFERHGIFLATWKRHYPHKLPPMRILRIFENFEQIKKVIQKPRITEEWIEEKASELHDQLWDNSICNRIDCSIMTTYKDFIRSLIEEIHGRKQD